MNDNNGISFFSSSERPPFKVISLHEEKDLKWEELIQEIPHFNRGWWELSRITRENRIEFTLDYWMHHWGNSDAKSIEVFFENLEDIGVFAYKQTQFSSFEIALCYIHQRPQNNLLGYLPATHETLKHLEKQFSFFSFPDTYLSFLKIHDGICKFTDVGLINTKEMAKTYQKFRASLAQSSVFSESMLIPFYEGIDIGQFQCFFRQGGLEPETIFVSLENLYSNFNESQFPGLFITFSEWLFNYLNEE